MDRYELGAPVPLTLTVTDELDAPVDPTSTELVLIDPAGVAGAPIGVGPAGTGGIVREDVGLFRFVTTPPADGVWRARWTTTGPGAGVQEFAFVIEPVGISLPYQASVEGVRARVLDVAKPAGAVPVGAAGRPERVTDAQITEWLIEGGARVGRRLRLIEKMGADEADPIRLEYRAAARGLTELYAAALLWDATYPQAAKGDRYGAVLFARFETGLKELAADLAVDFEAQLTPGGEVEVVDDGEPLGLTIDPYDLLPGGYGPGARDVVIGGPGASARFPARDPRISRHHPW